jgi:hypothetical protein
MTSWIDKAHIGLELEFKLEIDSHVIRPIYIEQCILKNCNLGSTKPEFLGSKF